MSKIKQIFGISVASLGLVAGLAGGIVGAAPSIGTTGHESVNIIKAETENKTDVDNDNDLGIHNRNSQKAFSGEVESEDNTTSTGSTKSGDATNTNKLTVEASVTNTVPKPACTTDCGGSTLAGSINTTGSESVNVIKSEIENRTYIDNDNDLSVCNSNTQLAISGDVEVEDNTTTGSATSGDASNTNNTNISFTIKN